MSSVDPRFPIGKFIPQESYTQDELNTLIHTIESIPGKIETACTQLVASHKLETPYRPEGWTARQVIHHLADSHMNAYIRCKWTLTEDTPTIKAYNEKAWAETYEIQEDPALSVYLLKTLHTKWVTLLRALTSTDLKKSFIHPESGRSMSLERMIALYAWHSEHHLGHLKLILK